MIIVLKNANFSASNIGTLSTWRITRSIGAGASYDGPISVDKGVALSATVTLAEGYEIGAAGVAVTMGGAALEGAYAISGNVITITIAEVTGNVLIKVPTINTATGEEEEPEVPDTPDEPGTGGDNTEGTETSYTLVYSEQDLIHGYVKNDGTINTEANHNHNYFILPATGVQTVTITPIMAGKIDTISYVVHKNADGAAIPYAPINKTEPTVINLGGTATGVLYFNVYTDEDTYEYVKEATVVMSSGGSTGDDHPEGTETVVYSEQTLIPLRYVGQDGTINTSDKHSYFTLPADGIQTITITPPDVNALNSRNTISYVIVKATDGTVTHYAPINAATATVIELGGTTTGTVYFNVFTDETDKSTGKAIVYVKQAVITW